MLNTLPVPETSYASLSVNCKCVYMRLACYAVTKVGLALQERKTKSNAELHHDSISDFVNFINLCDVVLLCQEHLQTDCPSTDEIMTIKATLIHDYGSFGVDKVSTITINIVFILFVCIV